MKHPTYEIGAQKRKRMEDSKSLNRLDPGEVFEPYMEELLPYKGQV